MSRIISAITPGRPSAVPLTQSTPSTHPSSSSAQTTRAPTSATATPASSSARVTITARRRTATRKASEQPKQLFKTPTVQSRTHKRRLHVDPSRTTVPGSPELFEMQEFSGIRRSDSHDNAGSDFPDSAYNSMMSAPGFASHEIKPHRLNTSKVTARRSPRLAQQRELRFQQVGQYPSSSIVSPVSR